MALPAFVVHQSDEEEQPKQRWNCSRNKAFGRTVLQVAGAAIQIQVQVVPGNLWLPQPRGRSSLLTGP